MSEVFDARPFIDREGTVWEQVRCAGCGRAAGHTSPSSLSRALYCSPWCVWEHEVRRSPAKRVNRVSRFEARNDAWYWLFQVGYRPSQIAVLYEIKNDARIHGGIRFRRGDDASRLRDDRPAITRVTQIRVGDGSSDRLVAD